MLKATLTALVLSSTLNLVAQFHMNKPDDYYDQFHFAYNHELYAYAPDYQSYEINLDSLYNEYLSLNILNISSNLRHFCRDEEGVYLPYDKRDLERAYGMPYKIRYTNRGNDLQVPNFNSLLVIYPVDEEGNHIETIEARLETRKKIISLNKKQNNSYSDYEFKYDYRIDSIPKYLLDTIIIIRNPPHEDADYKLKRRYNCNNCVDKILYVSSGSEIPMNFFKYTILDTKQPESQKYLDFQIEVQIEMQEGDLLTDNDSVIRKVIDPHRITNKMLKRLSIHLQELGYLTTSANRYIPEIRDAIYELQLDHGLPTGFLDEKTFEILKLDFKDSHCTYKKGRRVCYPASLMRSYKF